MTKGGRLLEERPSFSPLREMGTANWQRLQQRSTSNVVAGASAPALVANSSLGLRLLVAHRGGISQQAHVDLGRHGPKTTVKT